MKRKGKNNTMDSTNDRNKYLRWGSLEVSNSCNIRIWPSVLLKLPTHKAVRSLQWQEIVEVSSSVKYSVCSDWDYLEVQSYRVSWARKKLGISEYQNIFQFSDPFIHSKWPGGEAAGSLLPRSPCKEEVSVGSTKAWSQGIVSSLFEFWIPF